MRTNLNIIDPQIRSLIAQALLRLRSIKKRVMVRIIYKDHYYFALVSGFELIKAVYDLEKDRIIELWSFDKLIWKYDSSNNQI